MSTFFFTSLGIKLNYTIPKGKEMGKFCVTHYARIFISRCTLEYFKILFSSCHIICCDFV